MKQWRNLSDFFADNEVNLFFQLAMFPGDFYLVIVFVCSVQIDGELILLSL